MALGIDLAGKPFVKSTLQLFRAQLHIHGEAEAMFEARLEEAERCGFLRGNKRTLALLSSIVGDAQRLLQLTRTTRGALPAGHPAQDAVPARDGRGGGEPDAGMEHSDKTRQRPRCGRLFLACLGPHQRPCRARWGPLGPPEAIPLWARSGPSDRGGGLRPHDVPPARSRVAPEPAFRPGF